MDEYTARNLMHCDGKHCKSPLIPVGSGYVKADGAVYCLPCAEGPVIETTRRAGALACLVGIVLLSALAGCGDKLQAAKDRAALLACSGHGGHQSYTPKLSHLVVVCKDGTTHTVGWVP